MTINRFKLLTLLLITSLFSFCQDLDDVFDDGDKESQFYIGTSINTLASGILNVYADIHPFDRLKINIGLGLIPFNTHREYTYSIPFKSDEISAVTENLSGGSFYSLGLALKSGMDNVVDFDYYYYIMLRNRKFSINEDLFDIKQSKVSLGVGYMVGLPGRFNLDILAGIATGSEKSFLGDTKAELSSARGIGFELSFGINYAL